MRPNEIDQRILARRTLRHRDTRWFLLSSVLVLSALYLVAMLRARAIWDDEALNYYTVHGQSLIGLWRLQASTPLVLEPPTNDFIVWLSTHLLGYSILGLRLPALLFYLALQYMLYIAAKALGGYRAGLIAVLLALCVYAVTYSAEPRPYALLMAMAVLALICWKSFHATVNAATRRWAAIGIALSLAVAITCNFFGFLTLLPVMVAELTLSMLERKLPNWKMLFALGAAAAAVLIDLPFIHASARYGKYNMRSALPLYQQMLQFYEWGIIQPPSLIRKLLWLPPHLPIVAVLVVSLFLSFPQPGDKLGGVLSQIKLRRAFWAGAVMLMLSAFPALAIIYYVTHVNSPRHGIISVPGVLMLGSVAAARMLQRAHWTMLSAACIGLLLMVAERSHRILLDQKTMLRNTQEAYRTSPAVQQVMSRGSAGQPVYLTLDECMLFPFYGDQRYRSRIRCLYSFPREIQYNHQVVISLTAEAFAKNTDFPLPVVPYEDFRAAQDPLLAFSPFPWEQWIPESLAADRTQTETIGTGFGGNVMQVHFQHN